MNTHFDHEALRTAVRTKLDAKGTPQVTLSEVSGLSRSGLSRYLNGGLDLGLDGVIRLTSWLGVPVDRFVRRPVGRPKGGTMDRVERALFSDLSMPVATSSALARILRVAHQELRRKPVPEREQTHSKPGNRPER